MEMKIIILFFFFLTYIINIRIISILVKIEEGKDSNLIIVPSKLSIIPPKYNIQI